MRQVEIARLEQRYAGLARSEQPGVALLSDYDVNRKWVRIWRIDVDDAKNSRRQRAFSRLCFPLHSARPSFAAHWRL